MRPSFAAFVFLSVLGVLPSAGQVRVSAPSAEAGAGAAGAEGIAALPASAVPVLALRYEQALHSAAPILGAGTAFLRDAAVQRWHVENRPEGFPALTQRALEMSDWEQVLAAFDDPRLLREALLSRRDSALAANPALFLALVDATPALAAKRGLYEEATLDWSVIGAEAREVLTAAGADERRWARTTLPDRYEILRRTYEGLAAKLITVPPGDPAYAAQYAKIFEHLGPVMTNDELKARRKAVARARRLADGLSRAQKAADAAADDTAAALLKDARTNGDIGAAEAALERLAERLELAPPAAPRPADVLSPVESRALLTRLTREIGRTLRGTPIGDRLIAEIAGTGSSLEIDGSDRPDNIARYNSAGRRISFGENKFAEFAAALDRTPRDLLTDDAALADMAALYAHLFVHEATHHRQRLWAEALPAEARAEVYNWESEKEALGAQAAFLRQKRAADPRFAARMKRLQNIPGLFGTVMRQPEALASDPARMTAWLTGSYAHVPTLARSGARLIAAGIAADRVPAGGAGAAAADGPRSLPAALGRQAWSMLEAVRDLAARYREELRKLEP